MGHRVESEFYRTIDGKKYKVQVLPTGYAGRSISRQYFGGKPAKTKRGAVSPVERQAKV